MQLKNHKEALLYCAGFPEFIAEISKAHLHEAEGRPLSPGTSWLLSDTLKVSYDGLFIPIATRTAILRLQPPRLLKRGS